METKEISKTIAQFLQEAIQIKLIKPMNEIYIRNRLIDYLEIDEYIEINNLNETSDLFDCMDADIIQQVILPFEVYSSSDNAAVASMTI